MEKQIVVKDIEWIEEIETAAKESWDGFCGVDLISSVFECKHSGEIYDEHDLVVPARSDGKYVRATFEPRQIAEDFLTIDEGKRWAQDQFNLFVLNSIAQPEDILTVKEK